eukprot:TRINITY_DN192522_c0_g1_i3.p1 TRINITY_DN192522_c0_g1~~TRINITY_DN192522_c0_g1_i3.p1  ORF type:complete len:532 (-),score=158.26 TRINITY_DN192522_c0_g1_i3:9-1604(-)
MDQIKLFVGQVPKQITERELESLFGDVGPIISIQVIRDQQTHAHKGCAFVTYAEKKDAELAISRFHNNLSIPPSRNMLQVKFADGEVNNKVVIQNLPMNVTREDVQALLGEFRVNVSAISIVDDDLSAHKRWAIVEIGTKAQAMRVIGRFNKTVSSISPEPLTVKFAENTSRKIDTSGLKKFGVASKPTSSNIGTKSGPLGANLFIYHLPQGLSDNELAKLFSACGNVIGAKVFVDRNTGEGKGFGFVSYDSAAGAELAIRVLNGYCIGNKRLSVEHKRETIAELKRQQEASFVASMQQQQQQQRRNIPPQHHQHHINYPAHQQVYRQMPHQAPQGHLQGQPPQHMGYPPQGYPPMDHMYNPQMPTLPAHPGHPAHMQHPYYNAPGIQPSVNTVTIIDRSPAVQAVHQAKLKAAQAAAKANQQVDNLSSMVQDMSMNKNTIPKSQPLSQYVGGSNMSEVLSVGSDGVFSTEGSVGHNQYTSGHAPPTYQSPGIYELLFVLFCSLSSFCLFFYSLMGLQKGIVYCFVYFVLF